MLNSIEALSFNYDMEKPGFKNWLKKVGVLYKMGGGRWYEFTSNPKSTWSDFKEICSRGGIQLYELPDMILHYDILCDIKNQVQKEYDRFINLSEDDKRRWGL